jgi:hypothetical protein
MERGGGMINSPAEAAIVLRTEIRQSRGKWRFARAAGKAHIWLAIWPYLREWAKTPGATLRRKP